METKQPEMVAISNDGETNRYVAGTCIPPGETRHFSPDQVPGHRVHSVSESAPPTPDPVLAILDGSVPEVAAALGELSIEDIDRLEQAEQDGKTRKGVLKVIAEERLRRAAETDADRMAAELAKADDDELARLYADTDDDALRGMIEAEQDKRAAAG